MNLSTQDTPSTRPYLIRALHEWCSDNGFSPYIAVQVSASVQVPMAFVKNGEIVLNVSFDATSSLRLGNDFVEFKARFGGVTQQIVVPIDHVIAIYARENGQGMAFPAPPVNRFVDGVDAPAPILTSDTQASTRHGLHAVSNDGIGKQEQAHPDDPPPPIDPGGGPKLRLIK